MTYRIKVIDENDNIVDGVDFIDNLTVPTEPDYVNFNGRVGLTRCKSQRNYNRLVIMYFYPKDHDRSYGEFIDDETAYKLCANRNKLDVANRLDIQLTKEREVYYD